MQAHHWISLGGLLWTIIVVLITWIVTIKRVERRLDGKYVPIPKNSGGFRLNKESEKCMRQREEAEKGIIKVLRRMEKRMALGNLVMRDLVRAIPEIQNDVIERYEKDLGIDLGDRNFGIPEI